MQKDLGIKTVSLLPGKPMITDRNIIGCAYNNVCFLNNHSPYQDFTLDEIIYTLINDYK